MSDHSDIIWRCVTRSRYRVISAAILGGLCGLALAAALIIIVDSHVGATESPVPVNPVLQCRARLELVSKDRDNAQTEAAYFATRTHELTEQNQALAKQVQALEMQVKVKEEKK